MTIATRRHDHLCCKLYSQRDYASIKSGSRDLVSYPGHIETIHSFTNDKT